MYLSSNRSLLLEVRDASEEDHYYYTLLLLVVCCDVVTHKQQQAKIDFCVIDLAEKLAYYRLVSRK